MAGLLKKNGTTRKNPTLELFAYWTNLPGCVVVGWRTGAADGAGFSYEHWILFRGRRRERIELDNLEASERKDHVTATRVDNGEPVQLHILEV